MEMNSLIRFMVLRVLIDYLDIIFSSSSLLRDVSLRTQLLMMHRNKDILSKNYKIMIFII